MNFFVKTNAVLLRNRAKALQACNIRWLHTLMLAVAVLLLAACTALPKRTPPSKPITIAKPPISAPVQPASGIVVVEPGNHEQEKNRIKSALLKSSRDSLAASEVGYYMDVLQGRVKQKIGKTTGIGIARSDDRIVIVMSGRSGFEAGNNQISPGIRAFLTPLSKVLVEYRMMLVSVRIRADNSDIKVSNPQLTEQRAQAVARYLIEAGVSNKRMVVVGAGKSNSASASSAPGNRERIELQLEPIVRATSN